MKTNPAKSAFFNPRVLISLTLFGAGFFLAVVGLGAFSSVFGQSRHSSRPSANLSSPSGGGVPASGTEFRHASDRHVQLSPADQNGRFVYLIEFAEPGLLHRQTGGGRFEANSPQAHANRQQLVAEQLAHVQAISQAIGRSLDVTHYFLVTHSGLAARFTPEEAAAIRTVRGVAKIDRERLYHVTTFRSPAFIGADTIWNGTNTPTGVGTRGAGIIVAMLDTGIETGAHPSFANDPSCGHGTGGIPNKLVSALDCSTTDVAGLCNGPDPLDSNGHGTHTSSTAAGDTVDTGDSPPPAPPVPFTQISGVAPCASIRAYKVCPTNSCGDADIQAGMNSVILHGDVDVMNFSISGGDDPWNDNDRRKLDLVEAGVVIAASAGNTSATIIDPVGQVNHLGPWVMTVAASTRDGESTGRLSAAGPGSPPANTQNLACDRGSASPVGTPLSNFPIRHFTGQALTSEGCTADPTPFPPGFFNGSIAFIRRGTCTFTEKIQNAFNAGASMVLIRNNAAGAFGMLTPGQPNIPAYSMQQGPGDALAAFVDANPSNSTANFFIDVVPPDLLADFSLRGPTPGLFQNITKPDVTGPGVDIYAAFPLAQTGYGVLSGTSMSSPHAAGSAALVRAVNPLWAVEEVKSALMMTAFEGGTKENGTTPWDADDVGNGRLDLTKAARAGLVMNETFANFLAANPALPTGDPRTLNVPSVRDMNCSPSCTWTRTVRNTRSVPTNWTTSGVAITPGFNINVSPPSFSFTGILTQTQVLTITATPTTNLTGAVAFGKVVLSAGGGAGPNGGNTSAPDEHITVAIKGTNGTGTPTPTPSPTPGGCPTTITHSSSQAIQAGNSVACNDNATGFHTDNHYWRAFNMNTFTGGLQYNVTSASFGVESANDGAGTGQPVTVNIYTNTGTAFPNGTLTQVGTVALNVPDSASGTVFSTPIAAVIPAGTLEMVMEVFTPNGIAASNSFFIGSNSAPETGPSYLSAADCGIANPTPTAAIGFPNMHIVMNVNGSCTGGGTPTPTPTPTPTATPIPTATPCVRNPVIQGSLDASDPNFTRPNAFLQGDSCNTDGVRDYDAYEFLVTSPGAVLATTCGGATWDTFLVIYQAPGGARIGPPFVPNGCTNALAANDDFCGLQSQVAANVVPGYVYIVVTSFGSGEGGAYTLRLQGLCPTPTPVIHVRSTPSRTREGGSANFVVEADRVLVNPVIVNYSLSGNAIYLDDYDLTPACCNVLIPAGQMRTPVVLDAFADGVSERRGETATMTLRPGVAYTVTTSRRPPTFKASIKIVD